MSLSSATAACAEINTQWKEIERTIQGLTFYLMDGKNYVRNKSSLTRRKVLYSPQFERTRHYAGMLGQASKIASTLYRELQVRTPTPALLAVCRVGHAVFKTRMAPRGAL